MAGVVIGMATVASVTKKPSPQCCTTAELSAAFSALTVRVVDLRPPTSSESVKGTYSAIRGAVSAPWDSSKHTMSIKVLP